MVAVASQVQTGSRARHKKNSQSCLLASFGAIGDPDRTQTCDLQNRNLTFYSLNYGAFSVGKSKNYL